MNTLVTTTLYILSCYTAFCCSFVLLCWLNWYFDILLAFALQLISTSSQYEVVQKNGALRSWLIVVWWVVNCDLAECMMWWCMCVCATCTMSRAHCCCALPVLCACCLWSEWGIIPLGIKVNNMWMIATHARYMCDVRSIYYCKIIWWCMARLMHY